MQNEIRIHMSNGGPSRYIDTKRGELRDEAGTLLGTLATGSERLLGGDLGPRDVEAGAPTQATYSIGEIESAANRAAPITPVKQLVGSFFSESALDATTHVLPMGIAAGAATPRLSPLVASTGLDVPQYGLAMDVYAELGANADFDLAKMSLARLKLAHNLAREKRVAALITTSANWASAQRVTPAGNWNGATPNILQDIFALLAASSLPGTTLVMTEPASQFFFADGAVRDFVQAGGKLPRVVVASMKTKASGALAYIWGTPTSANVALVREPAAPEDIATARTFAWLDTTADASETVNVEGGYVVREYLDPMYGARGSRSLVVIAAHQETFVDSSAGALLVGALA